MSEEFNTNLPIYPNELQFWVFDAAAILNTLVPVWGGTKKNICDKVMPREL